jgi:hypothetical protein
LSPNGDLPCGTGAKTAFFKLPKDERHRGKRWRRKRAAYDRELAGKPVLDGLGMLVGELLRRSLAVEK